MTSPPGTKIGVCHVPPGGLWEHVRGQMGYQLIHLDLQMQNFVLVWTYFSLAYFTSWSLSG